MSVASLATATAGGLLVGLASVGYLLLVGRIAGVSGVLGGLAVAEPDDRRVRLGFLLGLLAGGIALRAVFPQVLGVPRGPTAMLVVAGLLVGVGTSLANGCTSGHGVCGLGRRSARSVVAVLVFMVVAMVTASLRGGAS